MNTKDCLEHIWLLLYKKWLISLLVGYYMHSSKFPWPVFSELKLKKKNDFHIHPFQYFVVIGAVTGWAIYVISLLSKSLCFNGMSQKGDRQLTNKTAQTWDYVNQWSVLRGKYNRVMAHGKVMRVWPL